MTSRRHSAPLFPASFARVLSIGVLMVFVLSLAPHDAGAALISAVNCDGAGGVSGTNSIMDSCTGPLDNPWVASGSATAGADLGLVHGSSRMSVDVGTRRTSPSEFRASSSAEYFDDLIFNVASLAPGEDFVVRITLGMGGATHAELGDPARGFGSASANMRLSMTGIGFAGGFPSVVNEEGTLVIDKPTTTDDITVQNGTAYPITLRLQTQVLLRNDNGFGSSLAEVDFVRTAGIIGFEYFALDDTPLAGMFSSSSGEFALYDPTAVPEPQTALLIASGLVFLGWRRRPKSA
jgi:hypothetical protein